MERHLLLLADKVSRRLRRAGRSGHCVTLRIRFADGTNITRQRALSSPTDDDRVLYRIAARCLPKTPGGKRCD
jgi:DNA polymerase-4